MRWCTAWAIAELEPSEIALDDLIQVNPSEVRTFLNFIQLGDAATGHHRHNERVLVPQQEQSWYPLIDEYLLPSLNTTIASSSAGWRPTALRMTVSNGQALSFVVRQVVKEAIPP